MTVDDLLEYHKVENDNQLHNKTKIPKGTISGWRSNGIPQKLQAVIQLQSNGALKADISEIELIA